MMYDYIALIYAHSVGIWEESAAKLEGFEVVCVEGSNVGEEIEGSPEGAKVVGCADGRHVSNDGYDDGINDGYAVGVSVVYGDGPIWVCI